MIKFENVEVLGWEHAIRGCRNPMNSWEKMDSEFAETVLADPDDDYGAEYVKQCLKIGPNDYDLMKRLRNAGTDHRKFMRMITVYVDITAPLYWWKEFDTYKIGTVANSCSTMHKIHAKEFKWEDFSSEHLSHLDAFHMDADEDAMNALQVVINALNYNRAKYLETKDKKYWWQMIQLLPSSYNQKRTVMLNYEVLVNIYKSRRNHKLDEWAEHKERLYKTDIEDSIRESIKGQFGFCDWIKTLPYTELITGKRCDIWEDF